MTGTHGFWRSVVLVLSGTAFAQAIPILGSLVIARLFVPAEFGLYASWLGVVTVAAVLVTGRLEMALAIEADGPPRRIAVLGTLAAIGVGLLCLIPCLLLAWFCAPATWMHGELIPVFLPAVAGFAMTSTWQLWAAAEGQFRKLAAMRIVQAASVTALQVGAGLFMPSAFSLATAHFLGLALALAFAMFVLPLGGVSKLLADEPLGVRTFWRRHRRFLQYSLPADGINTTAIHLPVIIVSARFGAEVAGLLALAIRTLGAPISLLGSSVLDVFRRRAAASWRERGECRQDYLQTLRVLALGAAAVAVAIGFFSEFLFAKVFGESWRGAGTIAFWLMPMFAMRFVASPLSYVFYVAGRQHVDLMWQMSLLAMTLVTLTLLQPSDVALIAYSAGYSLLYLIYLSLSYRFSRGMPK